MQKFLFFLMGALCSIGFLGCQKNISDSSNQVEITPEVAQKKAPAGESTFFDPAGLISSSQHGVLDTVQKRF